MFAAIMGAFSGIKLAIFAAGAVAVAGLLLYHFSVVSERNELREQVGALNVVVLAQKQTIEQAVSVIGKWQGEVQELTALFQETAASDQQAERYKEAINAILAKVDLDFLAVHDPAGLERSANRATADVLCVFERITSNGDDECRSGKSDGGEDDPAPEAGKNAARPVGSQVKGGPR